MSDLKWQYMCRKSNAKRAGIIGKLARKWLHVKLYFFFRRLGCSRREAWSKAGRTL